MGYSCKILYLESANLEVTHSTVVFSDSHGQNFWFEWAWMPHEGIHGPYRSTADTVHAIVTAFTVEYGKPAFARIGPGGLIRGGNEQHYINMVRAWQPATT
jgi:hypothetical protein